ncbi:MAG: hypothetical protein DRO06_01850 [Thermoproteota archaeon]|nr:MAG: hypothetical protein DRO06_01850 [Candidatus Korarchaeota archaeon]
MTLFVKLGGSLITGKSADEREVRRDLLREICRDLAELMKDQELIVAHGAGSFGHSLAREYGIDSGKCDPLGIAATRASVVLLNALVCSIMSESNLPAYPISPAQLVVFREDAPPLFNSGPVERALDSGVLPVLHGDVVPSLPSGCRILSADEVPLLLMESSRLRPSMAVFVTNVPGVLKSGRVLRKLSLGELYGIPTWGVGDATGGMKKKLEVAADLVRSEIEVVIGGFTRAGDLIKLVRGEAGTRIVR